MLVSIYHFFFSFALTIDGNTIIASMKISNNKYGFKLTERLIIKYTQRYQCEKAHCCIESTGIYSNGIIDYLQENTPFMVSVINPAQAKAYGSTILLRTKTDKVDAGLLARYVAAVKPAITPPTPKEIKELRTLIRHLDYLITRRTQEKTHLESASNKVITKSIKDIINHYDKQIEKLQKLIKEYLDHNPEFKERIELLKTIPGIGESTATILICELHFEDGQGKITTKAQVAHAGFAPRHRQSGISIKKKSSKCKTRKFKTAEMFIFSGNGRDSD